MAVLETAVFVPVDLCVHVWRPLIYHYLMSIIQVVFAIPRGEVCRSSPLSPIQVDKLMLGHVVVCIYVRQVVIFDMVIPYRTPDGLGADIDAERLCTRGAEQEQDRRGSK